MRQVKGSMLIMFVKAIKSDKTGAFDAFLTDRDRKIISGQILQSAWYPYETYRNCFLAVASVAAGNDPPTLVDWGRQYGQATMETVYKLALKKNDPQEAIDSYRLVYKNQFNFGAMTGRLINDREMHIMVEGADADFEPWFYVAQGWMERFMALCINKKVRSEILEKSWQGAPATIFRLTW